MLFKCRLQQQQPHCSVNKLTWFKQLGCFVELTIDCVHAALLPAMAAATLQQEATKAGRNKIATSSASKEEALLGLAVHRWLMLLVLAQCCMNCTSEASPAAKAHKQTLNSGVAKTQTKNAKHIESGGLNRTQPKQTQSLFQVFLV